MSDPLGANLLEVTSTLTKASTGDVLAERVTWARGPWEKARGLIRKPALGHGAALIITRAAQVHTFGLVAPIDVVFCSDDWVVLHVISPMPLRRVSRWVRRARYVIELPAGAASELRKGDQLASSDSVR